MENILERVDRVRQAGASQAEDRTLYRSGEGNHTQITYGCFGEADVERVVAAEVERTQRMGGTLEWDVFAHDSPARLSAALLAAGFLAEPKERVLALEATRKSLEAWRGSTPDIRRVFDDTGIRDAAEVSRDIGRNADEDARRLSTAIRENPSRVAAYVAYTQGEPAACARIHFEPAAQLAWLCGGRTKFAHRQRGLYTALVHRRIADAIDRSCVAVIVDALPTSEPILTSRGFRAISEKQAFRLTTPA